MCAQLCGRWSLARLHEAADHTVEVAASLDGYLEGSVEAHETITMKLGQLLEQVSQDTNGVFCRRNSSVHLHLAQCPVEQLPPLGADVRPPPAVVEAAAGFPIQANLWLCLGSGHSALHYDGWDNVLMVLRGVKRLLLLPPSATCQLRPRAAHHLSANRSALTRDELRQTIARLEESGAARRVEVQAGHTLFIPAGWWHAVDSPDDFTLAVNFWWHNPTRVDGGRATIARGSNRPYALRRAFEEAVEEEKRRLLLVAEGCPQGLDGSAGVAVEAHLPCARCVGACRT